MNNEQISEERSKAIKLLGFTQSSNNETHSNMAKFLPSKDGYRAQLAIFKYPTWNCQVSSIGLACNINRIAMKSWKRLNSLMYCIRDNTRPQVLVDVDASEVEATKERFGKYAEIVFLQNYLSSNGSNMVMILYKWTLGPNEILELNINKKD